MKSRLYTSSTTATNSMLFPQYAVDGRPVPVFFRDRPAIYHIFLGCTLLQFLFFFSSLLVLRCTLLSFLESFSSLMVQHKPSVERDFRTYTVASMHFALNTIVYLFTGKMDPVCGPSNSCKAFTIKQGRRGPILVPYEIQGCESFERNRRSEVGFGVSQVSGSVERQGGSPDECRDAEGEGSRSGANQARDGEGEGSSSGESQGQDRGEGSASGENQGGDRNAERSGSNDDEDECKRQRGGGGDLEQGGQESNQEDIDFSSIPETFMAIIGAVTIAVVDFHSKGAISSTILGLVFAINVFGFLCCMTSMLHRHRNPWAARIFGTIGVAAAGLGMLLLVSVYFSSYYGWIILGLGSLAILVICVWAFRP